MKGIKTIKQIKKEMERPKAKAVGKRSNTTVIGDPEEEKQSSGTKLKFQTVIQENVPNLHGNNSLSFWEWSPQTLKTIRLLKIKITSAGYPKQRDQVVTKERESGWHQTMWQWQLAMQQWHNIFKTLKERNCELSSLYPTNCLLSTKVLEKQFNNAKTKTTMTHQPYLNNLLELVVCRGGRSGLPGCRNCFIADNLKTVTKLSKSGPAFHYHFNPHAPVEECQLKNVPPVSNISLVSFLSNSS